MSSPDTIDDLLVRWQELRRRGEAPSVRDLCADHPALVEELRQRINAFESMEAMLGLGPTGTRPATHPARAAHTVPPHLAEKLRPLGYDLIELIDQGGMGVVYKATQTELRRTVALKMIAGVRVGPKQLARFRTEAEAVARLQHANIVQIYEVGEVDGHSFFSMEYVEGGTLAHQLESGPLPYAVAAELVEVMARAVQHAHARGIVHRDLKPANILLQGVRDQGSGVREDQDRTASLPNAQCPMPTLTPKLTDFGLAKRLGADTAHTTTGEVIGTPAYMAPEQARGETDAIGPAVDVYALGAILYESLTGNPPFRGGSVLETLRQAISDDPVPPRQVKSSVPRDLEAICLKCLEKQPSHRYASAGELADDLHRYATGQLVMARGRSPTARAIKWARRRRVWLAVGALLIVTASAIGGAGYVEREQRRARAVEVAPQAREILNRHCYECHGANPAKVDRRFYVLDRESLLDVNRKNVVPNDPDHSRLIQRIEDGTMPPDADKPWRPRVSEQELLILKAWIAGGAPEFPPEDPLNPTPPVVPRSELAAEVYTIFVMKCATCHQIAEARGGIKVLNHYLLVTQRKVVKPGKPEESELYQLIKSKDPQVMMPPPALVGADYEPLTDEEIKKVYDWIAAGAPPFPALPKK